ncbi:MAG: hypoxanthine phosphoribosyltransferase [Planctomycetota bacterium]|jgi:hypoxanthine phosphoribosyltransferase
MPEIDMLELVGEIIVSEEKIAECIETMAGQIETRYETVDNILAIVLLEGARRFANDLFEKIDTGKFEIQYIKANSYYGGTQSTGTVNLQQPIIRIKNRDVLVVDDIYDTGLTLKNVVEKLKEQQPKDVKTCVLLDKDIEKQQEMEIDFAGMKVPNKFLIGYGLDYKEQYRELPYIAELNQSAIFAS